MGSGTDLIRDHSRSFEKLKKGKIGAGCMVARIAELLLCCLGKDIGWGGQGCQH